MKVLVLHGYTQSGPGFQRKIKRLQLHLQNVFAGTEFYFPTGPIRLRPSEKKTALYTQQHDADADADVEVRKQPHDRPDPDDIDAHAWFVLHDFRDPPMGFERSLDALAEVLRTQGPFDGILGFSQGGLLAVMIASLLEGSRRRDAFARAQERSMEALPFPESFKNLEHPPLKFGIIYGAMMAVGKKYAAFYESIRTPFIRFSGRWDPVVSANMVQAVENTHIGGSRSVSVIHPGAHIVCIEDKYLDAVVNFIKSLRNDSVSQEPRNILKPQRAHYTGRLPLHFKKESTHTSTNDLFLDLNESMLEESYYSPGHLRPKRLGRGMSVGRTKSLDCFHKTHSLYTFLKPVVEPLTNVVIVKTVFIFPEH